MEAVRSLRFRVNVTVSVKGIHTFETTVDGEVYSLEEVLAHSDAIVKALEARYPVAVSAKE